MLALLYTFLRLPFFDISNNFWYVLRLVGDIEQLSTHLLLRLEISGRHLAIEVRVALKSMVRRLVFVGQRSSLPANMLHQLRTVELGELSKLHRPFLIEHVNLDGTATYCLVIM